MTIPMTGTSICTKRQVYNSPRAHYFPHFMAYGKATFSYFVHAQLAFDLITY